MNACSSNLCNSGRKACPCPDACQLPEYDPNETMLEEFAIAVVVGAICLLALICAVSPALV